MDKTLQELVTLVEDIREELTAIYNRQQNKMSAELKLQVKRIQDIRQMHGMITSNNVNWTCPDCIYTVLSLSVIPFIESSKYANIKDGILTVSTTDVDLLKGKEGETELVNKIDVLKKGIAKKVK